MMLLLLIVGAILLILGWALPIPTPFDRIVLALGAICIVIAVILLVVGALGGAGADLEIDSLRPFLLRTA